MAQAQSARAMNRARKNLVCNLRYSPQTRLVRGINVSEEEINLMKENAIPRNTKHATKFGMTLFKGKM